jgi:oxygen-independent coproporphyrinogen-3 oxidase
MIFSDVPVSLYIHVPWCLQKCPYCDFSSMATRRSIDQAAFFSAILRDITMAVEQYDIQPFSSVFLGGGTPSLLDPRRLGQFLDVLSQRKLIVGKLKSHWKPIQPLLNVIIFLILCWRVSIVCH